MRILRPLAGLLLLSGAQALASIVPDGPELTLNDVLTGAQSQPDVAFSPSGEVIAVWASQGQDGDSAGVFGRRFTSMAEPLGPSFQVNTFTAGSQSEPRIATDGSGRFVVVWQSRGQDGSGYGIFGQRFDPRGGRVGSEFRVNEATLGDQIDHGIAADAAGDFVVVWQDRQGFPSKLKVMSRRFDAATGSFQPERIISAEPDTDQLHPAVAMDAAGRGVVVWSRGIFEDFDFGVVLGRLLDTAGNFEGGELTLTSPDPGMFEGDYHPTVAMTLDGAFVVVWERRVELTPLQLLARPFGSDGLPTAGEIALTLYGGGPGGLKFSPDVAVDESGSFVATWKGTGSRARRYSFSGAPIGTEARLDSGGQGMSFETASPDMHTTGNLLVAWTSDGEIRARRFLALCAPTGVTGLRLDLVDDGAGLRLRWDGAAQADDYVVFEDESPNGAFLTQAGSALSGTTGLTIPTPGSNRFYLLAARSNACGLGPLH